MRVKTETYLKRIEAIYEICKRYAYEKGRMYLISLRELAYHLNNCWYANLFFTTKELDKKKILYREYKPNKFALHCGELDWYYNRLETTIKKIRGASVVSFRSKFTKWALIPMNCEGGVEE